MAWRTMDRSKTLPKPNPAPTKQAGKLAVTLRSGLAIKSMTSPKSAKRQGVRCSLPRPRRLQ